MTKIKKNKSANNKKHTAKNNPRVSSSKQKKAGSTKIKKDPSLTFVYGIHSVQHCLKSRKCFDLYITQKVKDEEFTETDLSNVNVHIVNKRDIDDILGSNSESESIVHQGCLVTARPLALDNFDDSIKRLSQKEESLILILDQLTDPHNLGAITRSAAAFNVDLIIISDKNSPNINNPILIKTACGGAEYVKFSSVINISKTLNKLKEYGYWSFALDERGRETISNINIKKYNKLALVMGAEGNGVRRLVKESCDDLVRLETNPDFPTLNVSNATAISLHQVRVGGKKISN